MITSLPPPAITNLTALSLGVSSSVNLSLSQTANDVTITPDDGGAVTIPSATNILAGMLDAARAATIDALPGSYNDLTDLPDRTAIFSMIFDSGGSAIVAPITRYLYMPFAATITGWALMADQVGSIVIDIWKEPLSSFPPTVSNSITGGNPMSLSSASSALSLTTPSSWTTSTINIGDCLAFNVASASAVQVVTAQLVVIH